MISSSIFCVFDTETTGLDPVMDRVCELACLYWSPVLGKLGQFESLVDPGRPIPPEASAVHHLTDEDVAGKPSLEMALRKLSDRPFQAWAAHNADFDFGFLPKDSRPVLCTLRLAKKIYPESPRHTNQYLRYSLKLAVPEAQGLPAHRALADVYVTTALLGHLLEEAERLRPDLHTVEELVAWTNQPNLLPVCRFGNKHRDKPWSEVPKDYLQWMLREVKDMDPDLRFTIEHWVVK